LAGNFGRKSSFVSRDSFLVVTGDMVKMQNIILLFKHFAA
jgi:hypothetical protein